MDLKKILPIIFNFIAWATPKRVLMLAFVSFACIFSITFYEHRASLTDVFKHKDVSQSAAPQEFKLELAPETKKHIEDLVTHSQDINMIMVVNANIRVNQREMIHYFTSDPGIDFIIKDYARSRAAIQPIFSSDEKGNAQMVSVINGEFGCYKYEEATTGILLPKIAQYAAAVCRVSLPPYYGEFSGYINITLKHFPDESLQNEIRIEAVRLATEIYFKSIRRQG